MAANSSIVVPDAVSKSLAAVAAAEGFVRPRIDVEPGSSAGDGFTSSLFRCRVQEEDSSRAALQLMCKTAELPSTESFIRYSFDSEDFMYRKILPAMTEIAQLEHPLPWPKHYFSAVEGTSTPSLVVEDLQPAGFAMADRRKPLDVQHCRLALRQLARFHGAGLALKHLRPDFTKDADVVLGAITKNEQMRQAWEQVGNAVPDAGGMVKDLVSDEVYQKLTATSIKFRKNFVDIMMKPSEGPAQSIIHGDCHVNNMMFQYDKSGAVTDCKLIDFQTSRYGWMSWDLGTLILVCTDKALRAEHWDDLLRGYHREVQDTLRAAGIQDPDAVYTWDQLVDSMRTECPMGMSIAPMLLNAMYADKETAERFQKLMAEMDQTAGSNAEFAEELKKLQAPTDVRQRIADIAEDLVNWGWL